MPNINRIHLDFNFRGYQYIYFASNIPVDEKHDADKMDWPAEFPEPTLGRLELSQKHQRHLPGRQRRGRKPDPQSGAPDGRNSAGLRQFATGLSQAAEVLCGTGLGLE